MSTTTATDIAVAMRGITKAFPGVVTSSMD